MWTRKSGKPSRMSATAREAHLGSSPANFVSPAVLAAMGSPLNNKYAEGYPGRRYYGGCEFVDVAENIAIRRENPLWGGSRQCAAFGSSQANMGVCFALLNPGDTVLGMSLNHGGHLTHGGPIDISGVYFNFEVLRAGSDHRNH